MHQRGQFNLDGDDNNRSIDLKPKKMKKKG